MINRMSIHKDKVVLFSMSVAMLLLVLLMITALSSIFIQSAQLNSGHLETIKSMTASTLLEGIGVLGLVFTLTFLTANPKKG